MTRLAPILLILATVLLGCASAETYRYDSTEVLCAKLAALPSYNLNHKARRAALAQRGANCDDADQAEIARRVEKIRDETSFAKHYQRALERQAKEKSNQDYKVMRCTKIGNTTECRKSRY